MHNRTILGLLLLVIVGMLSIELMIATPAFGHANHERSIPAPNAELETAPSKVTIWFSETIEPNFSEITVLDNLGVSVDLNDSYVDSNDRTVMSVSLSDIQDGTYTVVWKNLSTVDGHILRGAYIFAVGQPIANQAGVVTDEEPLIISPFDPILRWFLLLGGLLMLGVGLFRLFIVSLRSNEKYQSSYVQNIRSHYDSSEVLLSLAGAVIFIVASVAQLLAQTSILYEASVLHVIGTPMVLFALETQWGNLWLWRVGLALVFVLTLYLHKITSKQSHGILRPVLLVVLVFCAAGSMLPLSLTSHGAALRSLVIPAVVTDYIHLLAASLWVGGLICLMFIVVSIVKFGDQAESRKYLAKLVSRFSLVAICSVLILIITGLFSAWAQITVVNALMTPYGFALLIKLALFAVLLILGSIHLIWLRKRIDSVRPVTRLIKNILVIEVSVATILLLCVGFMTSLEPARQTASKLGLANNSNFTMNDLVDGSEIEFSVNPAVTGINDFAIKITDDKSGGTGPEATVDVSLVYANMDLGTETLSASFDKLGVYRLENQLLGLSGEWQANIVVRQPGAFDVRTAFRFDIQPGDENRNAMIEPNAENGRLFWGIEICLIGFILVVLALPLGGWGTRKGVLSMAIGSILFCCGMFILVTSNALSGASEEVLINPILPTSDSVESGFMLYQSNCAACHGDAGAGNGPLTTELKVPAANLIEHVPLHSDADLYDYISEGINGTEMPSFGEVLSSKDIWNVINYIKTFKETK